MYVSRRQKITSYLWKVFNALKEAKKTGNKTALIATASLDLCVKEEAIQEVLETFQKAKVIEIAGEDILVL